MSRAPRLTVGNTSRQLTLRVTSPRSPNECVVERSDRSSRNSQVRTAPLLRGSGPLARWLILHDFDPREARKAEAKIRITLFPYTTLFRSWKSVV